LTLPIALDAMGGDFAPSQIIEGARRAVDELGLEVILVGVPDLLGDPLGLEVFACSEIIAMDDDPGRERAQEEGLILGPRRRTGTRRQGQRHGLGR
jgi:glycerol-3-phosphate acyltransferase PlsX